MGFKKGYIPWNKGKETSEENKEKIRKALLGRKITWADKISKGTTGVKKNGDFSTWKIGRVGEKANRYIDGRTTYVKILKRTGRKWECELCGILKVEIHHKDKDRKNNNPNNLMILCKMCHEKIHHH